MSEMGNVKSFQAYLNQIYPGGSLYIILNDKDFKQLFMEETNKFLCSSVPHYSAARVVGVNVTETTRRIWVFSPTIQIDENGRQVESEHSHIYWLKRPDYAHRLSNMLINESLQCSISTPLDGGKALVNLCCAIQAFMPDNFLPTMATMAAFVMGTCYMDLIKGWGEIGIPFLYGVAGSCKSEALRCAASLFGAEQTHMLNGQTTASYLFQIMKETTITIAIDDISKKSQDTWEEVIVDASNNTPRGTRSYSLERFNTLPIFSANWLYPISNERAQTRTITIPFVRHNEQPNSSDLHMQLIASRQTAGSSVGSIIKYLCTDIIQLAKTAISTSSLMLRVNECLGNGMCNSRLNTTMTIFMYFFLEVSWY